MTFMFVGIFSVFGGVGYLIFFYNQPLSGSSVKNQDTPTPTRRTVPDPKLEVPREGDHTVEAIVVKQTYVASDVSSEVGSDILGHMQGTDSRATYSLENSTGLSQETLVIEN